jgi:hypothetical protein
MSSGELERMLRALLPCAGVSALTLTEWPQRREALASLIDSAIALAHSRDARLSQIDLPRALYPEFGGAFCGVPVADCGARDVLRLTFKG